MHHRRAFDLVRTQTDTLIARPLIPLDEATEYAVLITDRLVDGARQPVRSPFDFVYYPAQESGVARLLGHLTNPALATYFGESGEAGSNTSRLPGPSPRSR